MSGIGETPPLRRVHGLMVLAVAVLTATCSGDAGTNERRERAVVDQGYITRPWAAVPSVEATLEATSGDDVLLSSVSDVAVDSEGRAYVIDSRIDGIIALHPDLRYDRTIGREGEGPGEFVARSGVQVLPGDSVLVWDFQLQRLTVFPPGSDEPAYLHALGTSQSSGQTRRLTGSTGYLARSSTTYNADGSDEGAVRIEVLRHVREEGGQVVDEVVVDYPAAEALAFRRPGYVRVGRHPFGRRSFVGILDGTLIVHASSDAVAARIIDLQGSVETAFTYETTPVDVTDQELDAAVEAAGNVLGEVLREGAPYVWPTLTGLVVDDEDRIWLGIRRADRSIEWAAFTADGTHLASVDLPVGLEVHAVRGGRIVGVARDELDAARVVAYRLP